MKKTNLLLWIFLGLFPGLNINSEAQVPLHETGMRSILEQDPTIDNTGGQDVTVKLQTAIQAIVDNDKTVFIPSGTYKVSGTIDIENQSHEPITSCADRSGKNGAAIVGDPLDWPTFKLVSGTFTNAGSPKPVLHVWRQSNKTGDPVGEPRPACTFFVTLRNLNFDLQNNPGASGLSAAAAQDSDYANISVTGSNFHSGFMGLVGRNGANLNLKVTGGQYGVYLNFSGEIGYTLTGLTLIGQTEAAININGVGRGGSIVGANILDCHGKALTVGAPSADGGQVTLVDAKIELAHEDYAIDIDDRAITLYNVFVKGTNKIIQGKTSTFISSSTADKYTEVQFYHYIPASINGEKTSTLINGLKLDGEREMKNYAVNKENAPDMVEKNIPILPSGMANTDEVLLSFKTPGTVNAEVYQDAGESMASAIGDAFEAGEKIVFVPAGKHVFDTLVSIPNNAALIGVPGRRSKLVPDYNTLNMSERAWMVTTEDKIGYNAIQDIRFNTDDEPYLGGYHWRISDGFSFGITHYEGAGHSELNRHHFEFTNNAGGRFYGITEQNNIYPNVEADPNIRKIYIENTTNPITFYGLNLERGGGARDVQQYPFMEAKNSQNVRVLGCKTETDGTVFKMDNTHNFFITNVMSHRSYIDPIIVITEDCSDFFLSVVYSSDKETQNSKLLEDAGTTLENTVFKPDFIGIAKEGNYDNSIFNNATTPDKDTLSIINGYGSGHFAEGIVIGIYANSPTAGKEFDKWTGDVTNVADVNNINTTLTMPAGDVSITATYKYIQYDLNVTNGSGSGSYNAGTIVEIAADAPAADKVFDQWIGNVVHVADINSANTTVAMPSDEVNLTAAYSNITSLVEKFNLKSQMKVYPNPASKQLTLKMDDAGLYSLNLFNSQGQLRGQWNDLSGTVHINCAHYPEGLYFLEIVNGPQLFKEKVLLVNN